MISGALIVLVTAWAVAAWAVALFIILLGFGGDVRVRSRLAVIEFAARRFAIREGLTRDGEAEPPHEGA